MVDFSRPKPRKSGNRSNGLFMVSLVIIGVVGYVFVEGAIRPPAEDRASAPQSQQLAHLRD